MTSLDELASHSPRLHEQKLTAESDDGDTASQKSISLSSPPGSTRNSVQADQLQLHESESFESSDTSQYGLYEHPLTSNTPSKRESRPYTLDTDLSSDDMSYISHDMVQHESPNTSTSGSLFDEPKLSSPTLSPPTYPPRRHSDVESLAESFASGSSRKARPESILLQPPPGKLVLGIALVDFNHLVGPRIEWSKGEIFENEEIIKMVPFLALPDGAHLSAEDYSYFHIVPSGPNPTTVFGISCNQQIAASALLVRPPDVTRSTVQKAVVILASKPVFGPIRDKLGVVTTALFQQRDFSEVQILDDFGSGLELSLRTQMTESGLYMGTNLRDLVHTFRQRTLVLVKALILQKRIMFYGHPVERLCTFQYSLISLLPGLLQTLDDCGSPPLASRAPTLTRPTSLRTSDPKSLMAYTGFPLDIFGKDAFFQPYLPLQQLDMLKETKSWLCGSTNSIVTHQKEIDLLVNIETGVFEFRDQNLERSSGLTAADRKWMDDIVKDVNETWVEEQNSSRPQGMAFKGSDDYLRVKFDEYISAALASVRYRDFQAKGEGVLIAEPASTEDFNHLWMSEFKNSNAYEVWQRTTDPMLFDIIEPRHPCNEKVSVVADLGLRLSEGLQELKLDQQLAPAREAVSRTFTAGSLSFFKAVEGVRDRWQRSTPNTPNTPSTAVPATANSTATLKQEVDTPISEEPELVNRHDIEGSVPNSASSSASSLRSSLSKHTSVDSTATRSTSSSGTSSPARLTSWGSGISSFMSNRVGRFSLSKSPSATPAPSAPPALPLTPPPVPDSTPTTSNSHSIPVEPPTPTARDAVPISSSTKESLDENSVASSIQFESLLHTLDSPSEPHSHEHEQEEDHSTPSHVLHDSEDESEGSYSGMAMAM
ncbi:transport protein Avl9-domain-containing protein [Lentinula raphanica]|uniref:Transport protein Avl9-domain-containing protein n=1 Tax=Lentinula raphanica TaxID=153919 RepID=A0AA38NZ14_9AGAR|nr:transport protein Avl9-domain-containing protein [Lentinula raphanica]KAJ3833083.1 transport protein Avl9-domain-containing protein [Lentinula raphanica]